MEVSVRELKNHLSEYLRRVQGGEVVYVTSRGRRIARLLPEVAEGAAPGDREAQALEALDAMPWVSAPRGGGNRLRGSDRPLTTRPGALSAEEIVRALRD